MRPICIFTCTYYLNAVKQPSILATRRYLTNETHIHCTTTSNEGWMDGRKDGWTNAGERTGRMDERTKERTDGRTNGRIDERTDGPGRTDGWTDQRTNGWTAGWTGMNGRMDRDERMAGRTDRRMDWRTNGRADGCMNSISVHFFFFLPSHYLSNSWHVIKMNEWNGRTRPQNKHHILYSFHVTWVFLTSPPC